MAELVTLVDENDNVVGFKDRSELTDNDRWRIVAIWIFNDNAELLIAKRAANMRTHPGKWGPSAAGTVDYGESYDETATRELKEELGVSFPLIKKQLIMHDDDMGSRANMNFVCHANIPIEDFTIQAEEVEEIAWISIENLLKEISHIPGKYLENMNIVTEVLSYE